MHRKPEIFTRGAERQDFGVIERFAGKASALDRKLMSRSGTSLSIDLTASTP
jgi:hypothetical protein